MAFKAEIHYRKGHQDSRERYSNRVHLMVFDHYVGRVNHEKFVVMEFNMIGSPVGKDIFDSLADAEECFDLIVEDIVMSDHDPVVPI